MESIIKLPVSVHLIDDSKGEFTTTRTENEIKTIFEDVNRIWSSAQINFEISTIQPETIEHERVLQLLDKMYIEIPSDYSILIDIYFLKNFHVIPGINLGYTRRELRRVFIVDDLKGFNVHRCIAHEFGHILRLEHVPQLDRLMHQQGNMERLLNWEIRIARHMATM